MIAWMLSAMGCDPSFISGGVLNNLGTNAHSGKGAHFVIEADEYDRMFLGLKPDVAVVTNMEYDHPDCYPTPAAYRQAFEAFIAQMPSGGVLVVFGDDSGCKDLAKFAEQSSRRAVTYGVEVGNIYQARRWSVNQRGGFDYAAWKAPQDRPEALLSRVSLQVPGMHNIYNSLAALAVAEALGLPVGEAARALGEYSGSGRRFEILGEAGGVTVVDDYAHHPTEIQATLAAARARFPGKHIWAVWQPHTYSRTQMLFDDFVHSFSDADETIVTEVYAAREPKQDFSSRQIVDAMPRPAHFIAGLSDVSNFLTSHLRPGDALLVLSAGDADQVSAEVLAHLKEISNANTNG
jgi:UDP-N-acetylmuramate--alanine ligase